MRAAPTLFGARGMTLIEVIIATAISGFLLMLALLATQAVGPAASETSLRAHQVERANAALRVLETELSGGSFTGGPNATVFAYSSGALGAPGAGDPSTGEAIQYNTITGYTAGIGVTTDPNPIVFAFVPGDVNDDDRDGLTNEWRLVRIQNGNEVTILNDIANAAQPNSPVAINNPTFSLTKPSNLRVRFSVMRSVRFDTTAGVREYAVYTIDKTINLRNLNN